MGARFKSFRKFMIDNYLGYETKEGDLANDIMLDDKFPKTAQSFRRLFDYLLSQHACEECLDVFGACWSEYDWEKKMYLKINKDLMEEKSLLMGDKNDGRQ